MIFANIEYLFLLFSIQAIYTFKQKDYIAAYLYI